MPILPQASGTDAHRANFNEVGGDQTIIQGIHTNISGTQTNIHGNQTNIYHDTNPDIHTLLLPVLDAGYDRALDVGPVSRCHQDTRKDVIDEIVKWVKKGSTRICWLNGSAGSGKSAISQAIAERYAAKKRLGASFFFFRGAGNRSKMAHFISTLAYQLSLSVPSTKPLIQQVLRDEKSVTHLALIQQITKLIVEPSLSVKTHLFSPRAKPIIIVIDGLDECDDENSMMEFIDALIDTFQKNPRLNFRVIITSRLEEHIRKLLITDAAHSVVHHLALDTFDAGRDIRVFFQSRFSTIYQQNRRFMQDIALPWPSESDLNALVEKCGGSFILATTILNFIDDGRNGFPHQKIRSALEVEDGLDPLYTEVLSRAPKDKHFGSVIGTVMLLTTPIPITSLACLLQLKTDEILHALVGIQSILRIPGDNDQPLQVFHTSLRDFLTLRSSEFFINPPIRHLYITTHCLTVIGLMPEDSSFYDKREQEYACFNWCHHLYQGLIVGGLEGFDWSIRLMNCIAEFASQWMEPWVNTVLWKGNMEEILTILSKLPQTSNCPEDLKTSLKNIEVYANVLFSYI